MIYNKTVNVGGWNINSSYDIGVTVVHNNKSYTSIKSVPKGINIGDTRYWAESVEEQIKNKPNDLSELGDVELSSASNGQALVFNGTKWVNRSIDTLHTYSTTEQLVGYLDDGVNDPVEVYERTFIATGSTSSRHITVASDFTYCDGVIMAVGCAIAESGHAVGIGGYWGGSKTLNTGVHFSDSGEIDVDTDIGGTGTKTIYLVVTYIKPTEEESEE